MYQSARWATIIKTTWLHTKKLIWILFFNKTPKNRKQLRTIITYTIFWSLTMFKAKIVNTNVCSQHRKTSKSLFDTRFSAGINIPTYHNEYLINPFVLKARPGFLWSYVLASLQWYHLFNEINIFRISVLRKLIKTSLCLLKLQNSLIKPTSSI